MTNWFVSFFVAIGALFGLHYQQPLSLATGTSASDGPSAYVNPEPSTTTVNVAAEATTTSTLPELSLSTTGWQTYQNDQYGISFKYPSGWSISSSSLGTIVLDNEGYDLVIDACSVGNCGTVASEQSYDQNALLFPNSISLNVAGHQAWRPTQPSFNGENSYMLEFNFTFLRPVSTPTNNSGFNDTSKFTPISNWVQSGDLLYGIYYVLPSTVTASSYDSSMIRQMDDIVQSISFAQS